MTGNDLRAGVEVGEPRFNSAGIDRTVWYSFRAPRNRELILDTSGSAPNRQHLAVFSGSRFGRLDLIDASRWNDELDAPEVSVPVTTGATYQIVVGSNARGARNGRYTLNWRLR